MQKVQAEIRFYWRPGTSQVQRKEIVSRTVTPQRLEPWLKQASRAQIARQRMRIRREARARARRLRIEWPSTHYSPFWFGVRNALLIEAAFIGFGFSVYYALRWFQS